ncbi:hypothetical protein SAMN04488033_101331 [Salegentibacter agarivorans]|uniref:SGNH/GDSL hydrolase family protein n=1 Tax=Salegentibacter agarivorans TaxID=345907 RepID=A0A1I2JZH6_9FLAO|nr:hypothetical protein [Salegentibacter agarivorans]SFF60275.1 hypothetical protein SAMN04488033_101331 [Salegentibacter agarivorans]
MKRFLKKAILFFLLVLAIYTFILVFFGGYVDYFYNKFTTPKQSSLIIGDSRSLQGIQPSILNECLSFKKNETQFFNYSFTISQATYGPLYTKSIFKKLDTTTVNKGVYILNVNPWMLARRPGDDFKNSKFIEENVPPHNMDFVNMNPNYEYLIRNYKYFHFRSLIRRTSKLHKDGWLEERNLPKDSITLQNWTDHQIKMFQGFSNKWKKSPYRKNHLKELIVRLKKHGEVFLVRLPISEKVLEIEENFWSKFSKEMNVLAKDTEVTFIDFSKKNQYKTYDGHHLTKNGGKIFTKDLCDSILKK